MSRETFQSLRMLLMEKLDLARELTDEEILEEIDTLILERMRDSCLSLKEKVQLRQELFHSVRKLDVLQELIEDETVTEIMVNGPDAIFVERAGKLSRWEKTFTSGEKLEDVIQQIVGKCNRVVNESMPIVDARLENGARVNAVVRPVALNGPILTIRRFPDTPITMEKLIALGSLPAECAEFLKTLVRARYSMVIGGGTGSGKTTFLGALSNFIPSDERLITIEDNAELKIQGIENLVRLEAKMANTEGATSVTIRDLIKTALRMRPDRIIVGETRDGAVVSLLSAMSTGHEGSMSTGHANSPENLVNVRIPTMMEMDKDSSYSERAKALMIAEAIQLIVQLRRLPNGRRVTSNICSVEGIDRNGKVLLQNIFVYDFQNDKFVYTGNFPKKIANHLEMNGVPLDPSAM